MNELVERNSQFIISTHSPMLMAYPGAEILELSETGVRAVSYKETEHYQATLRFLQNPEKMLEYLFENDQGVIRNKKREGERMYVLCAMETVKNHKNLFSTTQLAAMRVNENWVRKDTFHSPIEPLGPSFHLWQDPAFTGYSPQEFLNAPNAYLVLRKFEKWLHPDDVLCWWNLNEKDLFIKFYSMTKKTSMPHKMLDLKSYFHMTIQDRITLKGNVFKLSSLRGIPVTGKEHCSLDRVYAMSAFLHAVNFDQTLLLNPPQERIVERDYDPEKGHAYVYQPDIGIFHQTGCSEIRRDSKMEGYGSLAGCMRRRFKPCSVCALKDANTWRRERNKDSIERSAYKYVLARDGKVFHTTSCALVLSAKLITGSQSYRSCIRRGLRPCRVCKPESSARERKEKRVIRAKTPIVQVKSKKQKKVLLFRSNRALTMGENRALARLVQVQKERKSHVQMEQMSSQERADHLTLTQPTYAFFSGTGYQTFHLRTCAILKHMTEIKGFSTCEQALAAGKTPCKICKPTPKANMEISVPITNQIRENESESTLMSLCEAKGIPYNYEKPYFHMQTPAGKWKIDVVTRPVIAYHINLAKNPNQTQYHRQHRLFLSLKDTFDYIYRHDHKD